LAYIISIEERHKLTNYLKLHSLIDDTNIQNTFSVAAICISTHHGVYWKEFYMLLYLIAQRTLSLSHLDINLWLKFLIYVSLTLCMIIYNKY